MCKNTFTRLHFEVQICTKTKAKDIINYLKAIANTNHSKYDCFILYVSSHGGRGFVCGSDFNPKKEFKLATESEVNRKEKEQGYILYDTILETFLSFKHCTTLSGKPKLFFFDCCRNEHETISKNANESPIRGFQNPQKRSEHFADILIGYATISGYAAGMNLTGSNYTKVLTECLNKYAQQESLGDVIAQVNFLMQKNFNQLAESASTMCGKVVMHDLTPEKREL